MKTESEIIRKIWSLRDELELVEKQHNSLGQIDALSGEGSTLRAEINNLKGQREALKWIIE